MTRIGFVFTLGVFFCLAFACSGMTGISDLLAAVPAMPWEAAQHPKAEGEDAAPERGDYLVLGTISEPTSLIPPLSTDSASSEVSTHLYVGLLRYDKDLNIVPWAAESYEVLEDGLLLRFTLRKGIRWQDGEELTAEDVAFTCRMMRDPNTPTAYGGDYRMIADFAAVSRYEFEVRYDKPFARSLTTWLRAILPRHVLEGADLTNTPYLRNPVGCGPFLLEDWRPGQRLVLKANDDYFLGRPKIDGLIYTFIPDPTTMFLELRAGKVDLMGLTAQQYMYQRNESFREQFATFRSMSFAYTYLGYNLESPLFRDLKVRQAIAHALDKRIIVAGAMLGQGEPTIGPYTPGTWPYNTAIADYEHDLDKARALLAEAGWLPDEKGMLRKGKLPFTFTILTNQGNEQRIKTAVIIQAQLKKIGIEARIRTVEWATFFSQFVNKGFFDAVILGWTVPLDPDLFDVWHSSRIEPPGLNFMKYADAELDEILIRARETFDQDTRKRLYDRAQEILHRDQPYCFLYAPYAMTAVSSRFREVSAPPLGVFWNLPDWWVPQREQRYTIRP